MSVDDNQVQKIGAAPDLRKWRIELPNMIDDSDLTPYEVRLLLHYYRRGKCWESVRTTATKCHMSVGMVVKARESLAKKEWIIVEAEPIEGGTLNITPVNMWMENFRKYAGECSPGEQGCSCGEQGCSCGEPKNQPIKNDKDEEALQAKTAKLTKLYESNIGALTPLLADSIKDAAKQYPEDWFEPAFKIAVKNNARSWNYVETILDSWERNYFGWKPERRNGRKKTSKGPEPVVETPEQLEKRIQKTAELMKDMIDVKT